MLLNWKTKLFSTLLIFWFIMQFFFDNSLDMGGLFFSSGVAIALAFEILYAKELKKIPEGLMGHSFEKTSKAARKVLFFSSLIGIGFFLFFYGLLNIIY
ncbi:MAG: hypothetical protein CBE11_03695 [Rickettsiales bacterium TMED251]|nr:MAG: hypothetical protein CBE11_03695 [Rickettsiales bacterium TMED251]|tara:strand:+ start:291 stop:587 length:297 start_codon:yes stop_codon:yes gene_type:complete